MKPLLSDTTDKDEETKAKLIRLGIAPAALEKEQWDLQGVLDAGEATQRDRDRLGALNIEQRELTDKKTLLRSEECKE